MPFHFCRGGFCLLVLAGLLLGRPGAVQAHPALVGRWVSIATPPACIMEYTFGPGEYIGFGVWRGPLSLCVAGCPISVGTYELRMFSATQGAIAIRDGTQLSPVSGTIDLGIREMLFMNTIFRP